MKKPYITTEIGINHNGSIDMAKMLIDLAKMYGANAVKFQKRNPEKCVPKDQWNILRDTPFGPGLVKYIDYRERMEFGKKEFDIIDGYCNITNMKWFASVWDDDSMKFISQYSIPFIKVPSACITDFDLLQEINKHDIPVILSTGMSTEEQIDDALNILDNVEYILHCVSSYPTPDEEMNMKKIRTLKRKYGSQHKIGFSNHSMKIIYTVQAYIMGAEMLEFHITLDRAMKGTDHGASIGPRGFEKLMKHISSIQEGWGNGKLKIMKSEEPIIKRLRNVK